MIAAVAVPLVRRAILDLLFDLGGEHNDETLTLQLREIGHRVARRDIADELAWLADKGLIASDVLGPFRTARILTDGRDVAEGMLRFEGVSPFKTGE